ncbi:MAG: RNA recognition motif domain-containing protein [Patescibacteria group bacterium]
MYSQDESAQADPKKLFVGNLPYSTTDAELNDLFSQFGEIEEVKVVTDRMTGRSRGIAFVRFVEESAAQAALALNETEMSGRKLIVNVARPRAPRDNNSRGGSFSRGGFGGGRRDFGGDRNRGYGRNNDR